MISELRMQQFRCFEELRLELPKQGALFIGDNAQGKTSILEAVCMLVRLQSPRTKRPKPMIHAHSKGFGIAGECWDVERQVRYSRGGLSMQVEGEEVLRQSEYFDQGGLIVWMGNEDLELIRGGGETRRRYIDFLGCQIDPLYRQALSKYRRSLKVRNLLLKDPRPRTDEITAYTSILVESGNYLTTARRELIDTLQPSAAEAQLRVGKGDERLELEYRSGSGECLATSLQAALEKDKQRGQTSVGPHRDELNFLLNGLKASDYASEGQQRTLALALKLAQGEKLRATGNKPPIYLLDDIFGELDPTRRNAVIDYLPTDAQVLITTTNLDWLDAKWSDWKRFMVKKGTIS